jgi:hypothetical protein
MPVAAEIKACPLRVAAEAVVVAVGAEAAAVVAAEAEAAVAGNGPRATYPLSKGGKSHGAIHQYEEKRFMV